jgi:hypothetical protein
VCDHHLRQPPPQRTHHAVRLLASSRRVGGCVLAQRTAFWRRARSCSCSVSVPQAHLTRCSSSPSALCRLSRCAGARRHGWARQAARLSASPTCACARPGAYRAAWRAEWRDLGGLRAGDGPAARWWTRVYPLVKPARMCGCFPLQKR